MGCRLLRRTFDSRRRFPCSDWKINPVTRCRRRKNRLHCLAMGYRQWWGVSGTTLARPHVSGYRLASEGRDFELDAPSFGSIPVVLFHQELTAADREGVSRTCLRMPQNYLTYPSPA